MTEATTQTNDLKTKMQALAKTITQECKKFYPPSADYKEFSKSNTAINIACLQAIKFKQKHDLGFMGTIKSLKLIRRELKAANYNSAFVNDITLYLVQALMRTPKIPNKKRS